MPKRIEFDEAERSALAYLVGRELASNRYPNAPQLEPLKSTIAKLAPADKVPSPLLAQRSRSNFVAAKPSGTDQSGECRFKSEIQREASQDSFGVDTVARDATKLAARDHPDGLASVHDG
jgi:hypothetical protein